MSYVRKTAASALVVMFLAGSLAAQDRGIVIFGHGGGYSSTSDLNDAGTADFNTGFTVGGGVALLLTKNIAVRGNFTFAQSDIRGTGASGLEGAEINRFYYGGDIQLRFPLGSFAPYVFGGAGGVTLDPSSSNSLDSFTKFAGRFGAGFSYEIPGTSFGLFSEATGWVYDFDRSGLDSTQFDIGWTGGISYRFPF